MVASYKAILIAQICQNKFTFTSLKSDFNPDNLREFVFKIRSPLGPFFLLAAFSEINFLGWMGGGVGSSRG